MIHLSKKVIEAMLRDPSFQQEWVNENLKTEIEEIKSKEQKTKEEHHPLIDKIASRPDLFLYFS